MRPWVLAAVLLIILLSCSNPMVNYLLGDIDVRKTEEWIDPSPVAFYNGEWYHSLKEALDQAEQDGGGTVEAPLEIELRRNAADVHAMGSSEVTIPSGLHILLKPYTTDTPSVVLRRWQGAGAFITVENGGSLTAGPSVTIDGAGIPANDSLVRIEPGGVFTLDNAELRSGRSSGPGGGVYVAAANPAPPVPAALFIMKGGAARVADTDVYLETDALITLEGTQTGNPIALITPQVYSKTVQVLDGAPAVIYNSHKKFDVTPDQPVFPGPGYWRVNDTGKLVTVVARRQEGNTTYWYQSLKEAFDAATGGSPSNLKEVTLVANIEMDADDEVRVSIGNHIRLTVPADAPYSITRIASTTKNIFYISNNNYLEIGAPAGTEFVIDGGAQWSSSPVEDGAVNSGVTSTEALVYVEGTLNESYRGTFSMTSGAVLQNNHRTSGRGGGIEAQGILLIKGGSIRRNRAESGGGLYCGGTNPAMKTISGGLIEDNDAARGGGGIMMDVEFGGTKLTMTGGEIRNNRARNKYGSIFVSSALSGFGGGVFIPSSANANVFHMSGGLIKGNKSDSGEGNGIAMDRMTYPEPLFFIGGSARIESDDVHLHYHVMWQDCIITIESPLTAANGEEKIPLTMSAYPSPGSTIRVLGESASGLVSTNYQKFTAPSPYGINSAGRLFNP
jgi:hypothetical protein